MTRDEYMKLRAREVEEFVGKTVERVTSCYSAAFGLRFTDGTWFYARAEDGSFGDGAALNTDARLDDEASEAYDLGLIDKTERDAMVEAADRERAERAEKWDRDQYLRLKAKFEKEQPHVE